MNLKIVGLFILCICAIVGMIMSAKYLKNMQMWFVLILALVSLIFSIFHLVLLINNATL